MVEQKLPKPRHIKNNDYSCAFPPREKSKTTKKDRLNQGVSCHHISTPPWSKKAADVFAKAVFESH
jgi:hypothetical protein